MIEHDKPDVALVDVVLPDVSGLQLASTMTGLGIPVLMFTGDLDSQRRLGAAGIRFLPKPFQIEQFFAETQALFARAPAKPRRPARKKSV